MSERAKAMMQGLAAGVLLAALVLFALDYHTVRLQAANGQALVDLVQRDQAMRQQQQPPPPQIAPVSPPPATTQPPKPKEK